MSEDWLFKNYLQKPSDFYLLHDGYRYIYNSQKQVQFGLPQSNEFEMWICDHHKAGCKAMLERNNWREGEVRVINEHNHENKEGWIGFHAHMHHDSDERFYPAEFGEHLNNIDPNGILNEKEYGSENESKKQEELKEQPKHEDQNAEEKAYRLPIDDEIIYDIHPDTQL